MKDKLQRQHQDFQQLKAEGRLMEEAQCQLVPIEALQDTSCNAAVVNLYYQSESANEAEVDFDAIADEAWDIVKKQH